MNPQLVAGGHLLLALAGGVTAACGQAGRFPAWATWAGGGVVLVALSMQIAAMLRASNGLDAFRRWCARLGDADAGGAPPAMPAPFTDCARVVADRFDRVGEDVNARTADARRARVALKSLQNDHGAIRALLDNLSDGVLLVERDGKPSVMNRAARQFLGLSADEPLSATLADAIRRPALRAPLSEGVTGGNTSSGDSRRTRDVDCSDQTERLVLRVSFRRVGPDGQSGAESAGVEAAALAILLRDVTREVELNRMKSDFASSVSHELKTPLCSMRAFLEMLIDGDIEGEAERTEHMRLVLNETERLTTLVQNLLNLSRLEAGITKMAREPVDVGRLLEHLREVVTPLANARKQGLVFELSEYMPTVTGDAAMLEQALMNLVSNAIKYTPEGGSIRVKAGWAGNDLEVAVKDTGVGIPEKALGLIFEKFTRLENHAGLKATGTGLGLPLAKFVAEAHGGRITVESTVGKGSEFRMFLPARRGQESREAVLIGLEGLAR